MKTRIIRHPSLTLALLLPLLSLGSLPWATAEDFAKNYGLKFKAGIGFYVVIDGVPAPLGWTKHYAKGPEFDSAPLELDEANIVSIPFDAQFYSYGLDFSRAGTPGPEPPHLLGYGLSYVDASGQRKGRWMAQFVPVLGYDEKVYRILFQGPYDDLRSDKLQYRFWAFDVPSAIPQGFLFHFDTPKFAELQRKLRSFVSQALSNKEKAYAGKLTTRTLVFDAQAVPFQIHFTSFDAKSGRLEAEASGLSERDKVKFTGQLVGLRQIVLKQVGADAVWELQLIDQNKLVGGYSNGLSTVNVEIALEDVQSK